MTADNGIIIVTGSNGRIGEAVMRRFTGRFDEVVGFDRRADNPPPPGCVGVPVDVTSDQSVREGLAVIRQHHGSRVASFVHLAAYYDFLGEPSPQYEEITVRGTGRLLRGLRELDFHVEQFIFSSTMLIHRPAIPGQLINEDSPIDPGWAYPESKVKTEQVIHDGRGDIPAVLLRISGVYDDECHSIPLAQQIQRIYERQLSSHVYAGTTAHGASYLHMDDLVDAIVAVVERRAALPPELALLLGEAETLSYDELQHTFAGLLHAEDLETIPIPIQLKPFIKIGAWLLANVPGRERWIRPWMIDRAGDHYPLDITRARTMLGWEPTRSLRATLSVMVATFKKDPLGWYRENELEPSRSMNRPAKHRGRQEATGGS
ncbi:MAG TPA: NAD(P)-dependent oxidoreductase [Acidimicrobiia bacterium]|nr:NAD(P)-dependent oxidoreductase [Acidimicrobiia bacterium]